MNRNALSTTLAIGAAVTLTLAAPATAHAHVGVDPTSTAAGSSAVLTFAIGHGCEGSPTTSVTFTIPESVATVTPTVNPGWSISEGDGSVTYTALTPLADDQRDTFDLAIRLPDGSAGDVVAFPTLQTCEVGQLDWSETAVDGEDEPEHPAPALVLTEASGDGDHHGATHADTAEGTEDAEVTESDDAAQTGSSSDPIARVLAGGGLLLGAIGLVVGITARRKKVG